MSQQHLFNINQFVTSAKMPNNSWYLRRLVPSSFLHLSYFRPNSYLGESAASPPILPYKLFKLSPCLKEWLGQGGIVLASIITLSKQGS